MSSARAQRLGRLAGVAVLLLVVVAFLEWRMQRSAAVTDRGARSLASATPKPEVDAARSELHVPRAREKVVFSGKIEDEAWKGPAARTGGFVDAAGAIARPYSEARFTWGDGALYVILYAADEDIVAPETRPDQPLTHDKFTMTFLAPAADHVLELSPRAVVTDGLRAEGSDPASPLDLGWSSGAQVLADAEEEIDNSDDEDEEWIVEATIPLASLGYRGEVGERIALQVERCDVPKGGKRSCGSWGVTPAMTLVLDGD